jgi:[lysine-biosynthesis-protein LysW]--L-2-aminoadipate ligase
MALLVIAGHLTPANAALRQACRRIGIAARLLPPETAARRTLPGEIVLGRIDLQPSLDGPEPGLEDLRRLEAAGVLVLNRAASLQVAHDKRQTARALVAAGLPHPRTAHVLPGQAPEPAFGPPYVVKPRFGSWGNEVLRCESTRTMRQTISKLADRPWFRKQGALVQELIPNAGTDLRLVVAGGNVVGAIRRVAAPHEWRTNVALGGRREPVIPSPEAEAIAVAAAAATGGDLVGIDLLPSPNGYVVLEVNGCVDFTADYSLGSGDVFEDAVTSLVLPGIAELAARMALPNDGWSRRAPPVPQPATF